MIMNLRASTVLFNRVERVSTVVERFPTLWDDFERGLPTIIWTVTTAQHESLHCLWRDSET